MFIYNNAIQDNKIIQEDNVTQEKKILSNPDTYFSQNPH